MSDAFPTGIESNTSNLTKNWISFTCHLNGVVTQLTQAPWCMKQLTSSRLLIPGTESLYHQKEWSNTMLIWHLLNGMATVQQSLTSIPALMLATLILTILNHGLVTKSSTRQSGMVYGLKLATQTHHLATVPTLAVLLPVMAMLVLAAVQVLPKADKWWL